MPSLPILGKMLLSIAMGREIKWTDLDMAIDEYRRNDEAFAEELLCAVEACLGTDDLTFKTGGLLREDESMRLAFMQRVVKRLQYILTVGYNEDINKAIDRATAETQSITLNSSSTPKHLSHEKPEKCSAAAGDKQCLHDDGAVQAVELLSEKEAMSSTKWLTDLSDSALKYAVTVWKADVISMSFGYQTAVPAIEEVIDDYAGKVLMFAAASNCGGNAPISWPARHPNVVCVFATDADGNFYPKNPTPQKGTNLAVLGSSVEGYWPPALNDSGGLQHKSGTSCATPIAAGIAGVVMNLMRTRKAAYLESLPAASKRWKENKKLRYEQHMRTLGKPWGMKAVLGLMAEERQGYHYIAPWRLLDKDNEDRDIVKEILYTLEHL
ncbi:hypothetical protein B0A55_02553 [Friedmanniomyces simplex]|uniref:Peptidase S8/S53 domain-containing protein n=1 Tax=Friedmanniomyces simplex TaxID=329884 RepID=A0A4U0XR32_9PEZI|nr:hypothetical protein B0A55_02553 [Friedmanniomyces simplex]